MNIEKIRNVHGQEVFAFVMRVEEFCLLNESKTGVCIYCGNKSTCAPDAGGCCCEQCGGAGVYNLEALLNMGYIDIV